MSNENNLNESEEKIITAIRQDGYIEILINSKAFLRDEAKEFQIQTRSAIENEETKFLVNFKDCEYISSEGLGCIADFWRKCSENDNFIMVSLFNQKSVNELLNFFEIIGLARVMQGYVFTDERKAKNFIKSK